MTPSPKNDAEMANDAMPSNVTSIISGRTNATERQPPVYIPDNFGTSQSDDRLKQAKYPSIYEGHLKDILIYHDDIVKRTSELAQMIQKDYQNERPLFLCVLKGASIFFHHLTSFHQQNSFPFSYEFIRAKSYEGTMSTGQVTISGLDMETLRHRHVIIVEDIVDTGVTLSQLLAVLKDFGGCKSVEICTMLEKRIGEDRLKKALGQDAAAVTGNSGPLVRAKYAGFSIPDEFVIGMGLDYEEAYRDLLDVWVISQEGIRLGGNISLDGRVVGTDDC